MTQCFLSDRILAGGREFSGAVFVRDGVVEAILPEACGADETVELRGLYLSAGWIDMHTHGGGGRPFLDGTADDVIEAALFHFRHGTTTILPTLSAAPMEEMHAGVAAIDEARRSGRFPGTILGVHMEGPYLSVAQCGAQNPSSITEPIPAEYEALVRDFPGAVVRWTYAPEHDRDGSFCRFLCAHGILPSAGHTDAIGSDMERAIANGCRLVTHLYSATSTVTRDHGFRRLGVIESAFLHDELACEIIADGRHLPPDLIRMILKIKGDDAVALITDSLALTGTDEKEGVSGGIAYVIEEGVCRLRDRSAFAGSIATADRLIRVLTEECGVTVARAVKMMTETPARILGIPAGRIAPGCPADLLAFDDGIQIRRIFIRGEDRSGVLTAPHTA